MVINGAIVSDLDMMFIESVLQEEISLCMMMRSARTGKWYKSYLINAMQVSTLTNWSYPQILLILLASWSLLQTTWLRAWFVLRLQVTMHSMMRPFPALSFPHRSGVSHINVIYCARTYRTFEAYFQNCSQGINKVHVDFGNSILLILYEISNCSFYNCFWL